MLIIDMKSKEVTQDGAHIGTVDTDIDGNFFFVTPSIAPRKWIKPDSLRAIADTLESISNE